MRRSLLLATLALATGSCQGTADPAPTLSGMRLLDPELVLRDLQGQLHLRIFPAGALRCDASSGHIRDAAGARVLGSLPGGSVTPRDRCGAAWAGGLSAMFGTASPVDECFSKERPHTVAVASAGTFLVLVHGQGQIRVPDGTTMPGILGAGCTTVTLREGDQQSVTIALHEQAAQGRCGDGVLDFDETCDLGRMNGPDAPCLPTCQTAEVAVNNLPAGDQRRPSLSWASGQRLVVAFESHASTSEDVLARYFTRDGTAETNFGALANEIVLGGGPGEQKNVRLVGHGAGFVASYDSFGRGGPFNVAAQAFDYGAPTGAQTLSPAMFTMSTGRNDQQHAAIALGGDRVVVVWQDLSMNVVRSASVALARPLQGPAGPVATVGPAGATAVDPQVVALRQGDTVTGFLVVWSSGGDILARRLDAMGAPMAPDTPSRVAAQANSVQDQPAVAALPDGTAVVAYRDDSRMAPDTDETTIRWVLVDRSGNAMGAPRLAPTTTAGPQARPALAVAPGSPPVVLFAWEDTASGHIRGRLRRADDTEVLSRFTGTSADFQLSTGGQGPPRVHPSAAFGGPEGRSFAVAWEGDDGQGAGIRMRTFPR